MKIPHSGRKKALIIVDVQKAFLKPRNEYIIPHIVHLIKNVPYDTYIQAIFHAEVGSIWDKQQQRICPENHDTKTIDEISNILPPNTLTVHKTTKSVYKGDQDVLQYFKDNNIAEVHIVGLDTNDCVLATAYGSFDGGLFTYVIEECCESSSSQELHETAIKILRAQNTTNNSSCEDIDFITI